MLTVQNDWIEYETEPVPARRVAVRGGAACAQRGIGVSPVVLVPAARPTTVRRPPAPVDRARLRLTPRGRVVLVLLPSVLALTGLLLVAAPVVAEAGQPWAGASGSVPVLAAH